HMAHIGAPGLATLAPRLVRRAVELAREARDIANRPDVPVAGVLSPLEHVFRPDLVPEEATAEREHSALASAMAEAGADMLYLDAFTRLRELRAALSAARATGLPFVAGLIPDDRGDFFKGDEPLGDAVALAAYWGADAVVLTGAPLADLVEGIEAIGHT